LRRWPVKTKRRNDLVKILRSGGASSQEEIAEKLKAAGHEVTQATVSRDLRELGAVKVRGEVGPVYRLADDVGPGERDLTESNLQRTLAQFAVEIKTAGSMVIVSTLPGHANAVARAIDLTALDGVAGTIAGDDTIFIAAPGGAAASRLAQHMEELMNLEEVSV
jgi:transcriptional regulator of arginine metabolism